MPVVVATEAQAYCLLEAARWGDEPVPCPHCGVVGRCRFLPRRDGGERRTRTGNATGRRVWKCAACTRQFSVLTATVLEGTRIPIRTWLRLLADIEQGRLGVDLTAAEARAYGLTPMTARDAVMRLRSALQDDGFRFVGR